MAFAIGHISGCHLNPAVSPGLWACGRFSVSEILPYVAVHVIGSIAGAAVLYSDAERFDVSVPFLLVPSIVGREATTEPQPAWRDRIAAAAWFIAAMPERSFYRSAATGLSGGVRSSPSVL